MMHLPEDSPIREHLKNIKETGERAAALTHQLLAFSRKQVLEMRDVDLVAVVRNIEKMLSRLIGEDIEIEIKSSGSVRNIKADPVQIEQVIMNLSVNARDAMPNGGRLTIETADVHVDGLSAVSKEDVPPGTYTMISVTDTGEGMSDDVREKIFEPFFTTKEQGRGTGLGLATVYGIVKQHKGHILVYSAPAKGTTFNIYFPVAGTQKDDALATEEEETLLRGDETILLVDDEAMICRVVEDTLQPLGYRVLVASHGTEALHICDTFSGNIDLLLTDVVMPGLNGKELVERFLQKRGETKVIYMSGYTGDVIGRHGVLDPGIVFLQKPLIPAVLVRKVREVLDERLEEIQKSRKS
jgi:CheY-like chemotaxis protein